MQQRRLNSLSRCFTCGRPGQVLESMGDLPLVLPESDLVAMVVLDRQICRIRRLPVTAGLGGLPKGTSCPFRSGEGF